jgi:hypothetical protein
MWPTPSVPHRYDSERCIPDTVSFRLGYTYRELGDIAQLHLQFYVH